MLHQSFLLLFSVTFAAMAGETPSKDTREPLDRFMLFNEKLKTAVCDENFVSRAPTLESITDDANRGELYSLRAPPSLTEAALVSYLLGDTAAGIFSEAVRKQVEETAKTTAAPGIVWSADQVLEAQSLVSVAKRRVALEICQSIVDTGKLKSLLDNPVSRFLEVKPDEGETKKSEGIWISALDRSSRFGHVHGRFENGKELSRFLVPGWLEPYEVVEVQVHGTGGAGHAYRRVSNPLTNNTQAIEVVARDGLPLGVLFLSHDPAPAEWEPYRMWSEQPEARLKQIEIYRQRIEFEALGRVQQLDTGRASAASRGQVRDLQEFYKNLLQAYQVFPKEKQFDTYSKKGAGKTLGLDEITRSILGADFLAALKTARVNGSYIRFGLFKPDPKLHAIYAEYETRLGKVGH